MAESIEELLGLGKRITIGGKDYELSPLVARDWAEIQREILKDRPDPVATSQRLVATLDKDDPLRRELLLKAYDDANFAKQVTARELETWRVTIDGVQFQFWLILRHKQPDVTKAQALALFEQFATESFQPKLEQLKAMIPNITKEDLQAVMEDHGDVLLASFVVEHSGLPGKNPASPTQQKTNHGTDHSRGQTGSGG